jgi:hypothetical protein
MTIRGGRLATAVVIAAVAAGCAGPGAGAGRIQPAATRAPAPQPVAHPTFMPAMDPRVQSWFKVHEPERLELQNALEAAQKQIKTGKPGAGCVRLGRAVTAMRQALPTPIAALNAPVSAGLVDYAKAATDCQASRFADATQAIVAGSTAKGNAEPLIDEILEGEY